MKARADTLFYGGKIYTMEAPDICKDAVVLKDGKFAYVGTKEEALEHFDCAKCIDLQGKTVLPGMGDSHLHFFAFCQTYTTVDLGGATSRDEALQLLRDRAAETPKGEWIKGSNFDQSKWKDCEDQLPTRLDLDEASTEHPIVIKRVCLHTAVANTMALEKANITNGYVFGPGGMVELDADGRPNGIFREQASKIYDNLIPDPFLVPTTREKCMKKGLALASSLGVTMMHTYAAAIWHYDEDFADYVARSDRGELPVRMSVCLDYMFDPEHLTAEQRSDPYRAARMGSFKSFSDGSLGSRSAKLYTDYVDDPGNTGILVISPEDLAKRMYEAYRHPLHRRRGTGGHLGRGRVLPAAGTEGRHDAGGAGQTPPLPSHPCPDGYAGADRAHEEAAPCAGYPAHIPDDRSALDRGSRGQGACRAELSLEDVSGCGADYGRRLRCAGGELQSLDGHLRRRDPSGYGRISRGRLSSRREDIRV